MTHSTVPSLSRRAVLGSAAALGAGAGVGTLGLRPAAAADDYETIRERFRADLIGSRSVDPSDPKVAEIVARYDEGCDEALSRYATSPVGVFSDLPLDPPDQSSTVTATFTSLRAMAFAHALPGGRYTGSTELADQLIAGLRLVNEMVYNVDQAEYDNWWNWEIGSPTRIVAILVMCHEIIPADLRAALCDAIAHFIPDPGWNYPPDSPNYKPSTGANRTDLCRHVIAEGVLMRRPERIQLAVETFLPTVEVSATGDGLLTDGSFLQHKRVAYNGTYGVTFLGGATKIIALLAQTAWQINDPRIDNLLRAVDDAYIPWVFNGQVAASVRGRGVAYPTMSDSNSATGILSNTLQLARQADPETAARWRGTCLGWMERSVHNDIKAGANLPFLALIEEAEAGAPPIEPQPVETRTFPGMDRVVHQRPGWAANVAIASNRINKFEVLNGQNRNPWHHGDGFLGLYLDGEEDAQFDDNFWPTVDPYRIPGTTVDPQPRRTLNGGKQEWYLGNYPMVGGCVVGGDPNPPAQRGAYAVWTAKERNWESTMEATLSWFFLDDGVVALGSGISAPVLDRVLVAEDAHVRGGAWADHNYGHLTNLGVVTGADDANTREAFLRFDLDNVAATNKSAVLNFSINPDEGVPYALEFHGFAGDWDEDTITWNSRPALGELLASLDLGSEAGWHSIDLTDHVAELIADGKPLNIAVRQVPTEGSGSLVRIPGRLSADAPYLEVELAEPGDDVHPIETVLENRKVPTDALPKWAVDGEPVAGSNQPGWQDTVTGTTVHLPGTAGYLMLDGERSINLKCDQRTGNWQTIFDTGPADPITRTYQTAWLDHGLAPSGAAFAYHLLPRISAAGLAELAASPSAVVVANRADLQAVAAPGQGFLGAAFHTPGNLRHGRQTIRTDKPGTIATRHAPGANGSFEVSVADPARESDVMTIEVSLPPGHSWRAERVDDTVEVSISNGTARLTVRTADTWGRSQRVLFAAT